MTDTPDAAIKLTDKAADKIRELQSGDSNGSEQALRVAVRGGGCSGFQYALAFDQVKDDDHVFEDRGVSVVVDKTSMQFVFGSEVDYVEGLQGAGFWSTTPTSSPPAAVVPRSRSAKTKPNRPPRSSRPASAQL